MLEIIASRVECSMYNCIWKRRALRKLDSKSHYSLDFFPLANKYSETLSACIVGCMCVLPASAERIRLNSSLFSPAREHANARYTNHNRGWPASAIKRDENSPPTSGWPPLKLHYHPVCRRTLLVSNIIRRRRVTPWDGIFAIMSLSAGWADMSDGLVCISSLVNTLLLVLQRDASPGWKKRALFSCARWEHMQLGWQKTRGRSF